MKIKKILKALGILLLAVVLVVGAYVAYAFIAYHRIEDNLVLEVNGNAEGVPEKGTEYTFLSYNVGFGAYTADFGFFMDGGTESRARSAESVKSVLADIISLIKEENADFMAIEEVDFDSDRSYHIDEREILIDALGDGHSSVFAQNYDSPYLFYPVLKPHGASKSGLITLSRFPITSAKRISLPVESGFMKMLDLDRCYSSSRVDMGDCELVIYTAHLSAYTSDGTIADDQLKILINDMQSEYEKGNYVICGGDFNKDLVGEGSIVFGVDNVDYSWAKPVPASLFENTALSLVAPFSADNPIPSCRNADGPYNPEQYVITPDGFIISDNVNVISAVTIDTGFAYSDHNPVKLTFSLD